MNDEDIDKKENYDEYFGYDIDDDDYEEDEDFDEIDEEEPYRIKGKELSSLWTRTITNC